MTSDSDSALYVEPKLSLTKVRLTLSNSTLLPHQTKTAVTNWFRCRSFAILKSVRFSTWVERRLEPGLRIACTVGEAEYLVVKMAYSATTRTGALGRRLSNHNGFFCKRNNNIHEFEGCFLRGQVSSNSFQVFNGWIVEPWIYWSACKKKLRIFCFQKMLSQDKKSSKCPGSSSCTEKMINVAVHFATTRRNTWKRKEIWELERISTVALKWEWYI